MSAAQEAAEQPAASGRRIAAFYVLLLVVVVAGTAVSISAGNNQGHALPIAGTYELSEVHPCLGDEVQLEQSGEFVALRNPDETLSGELQLDDRKLHGDSACIDGRTGDIEASVSGRALEGRAAGEPFEARLAEEPPDPGTQTPRPPDSIGGDYSLAPGSPCLGEEIELDPADGELELLVDDAARGTIRYEDGQLNGQVRCGDEDWQLSGAALDRELDLTLEPPPPQAGGVPVAGERLVAEKQREFGATLAAFFGAVAVVMIAARLFGVLATKVAQPRVMGEVLAGITLGPTVFGALLPDIQRLVFPTDIVPIIGVVANLGLIFYMFLVGLELDPRQLRGRVTQAALISNASVLLPMALGIAVAVPLYPLLAPEVDFLPFALFSGVSMSITAFPVLARILVERRMLKRPLGVLVMAAAAIDDLTAWLLIALATAIAVSGSLGDVAQTAGLTIAFCIVMFFAVRPLLARLAGAYDEAGRVPGGWIAAIFAGILLAAYTTESIGIALIIGAFLMGMVMPRHAGLTEDVTGRIEDFVVILLLPLFFAFTGLRVNVGLLDRPELWLITAALIVVAIVAKLFTAMLAARVAGFGWRGSAVIGTLMNTRGLTELIVLNLALEKGVISEALFASLVIMALVTTLMAGPLLRLLDPDNSFGAPVDEEVTEARADSQARFPDLEVPERAILVAPQTSGGLDALLSLAEPLARSEPPRELILAGLVRPPRGAAAGVRGGLQTENRLVEETTDSLQSARDSLIASGIAARATAFISADAGSDLRRLAEREEVDVLLVDGRRPLLGEGVPRGEVGAVLEHAPCDVGVLVAQEGQLGHPGADSPIMVPFGAAEHDWAALELAAWLAASTGAPLRLLGVASDAEERPRLSRMLADAGLLVQSYAGVAAETVISEPGRAAILTSASSAGLLVVGLSARWRQEGVGPTRAEIARAAPAPVLFVRRGSRPSALAPEDDVTRFTWSSPGMSLAGE